MLYYLSRRRLPNEGDETDDMSKNLRKAHIIQQLRMCQAFASVGKDVCFVSPKPRGEDPSWDAISEFYGLSTRFELKSVPAPAKKYSFPNYPIPKGDTQAVTAWLIYSYLTDGFQDGDIVFSRNLDPTRYFLQFRELFPSGSDISVWFAQHVIDRGLDDKIIGNRFYDQLDGLVCISETQKREMVKRHAIDPSKIVVAHDGVDRRAYESLSTASARERLGFDPDERIVMYTGHLYPSKDVETLVRAAADFDGTCYIVGGFEEDISRIETEVEIPENVTFTGFVPPSEVPLYQTAADVLVATVAENPDQDYFSPLKMFEYMAAGKPIVVTRKPDYEEVLTDERNALFVEAGSVSELAGSVRRLLDDPSLRAELGKRAREDVREYDWNVRAKRLLDGIRGKPPETASVPTVMHQS